MWLWVKDIGVPFYCSCSFFCRVDIISASPPPDKCREWKHWGDGDLLLWPHSFVHIFNTLVSNACPVPNVVLVSGDLGWNVMDVI